ncbi:MAG: rod shape-determining protein MreD [Candidatus Marinimicrobia bacterium]|nr:rod shape-determining protein MreD [Candidatus Neomarinimicrobiota bacterium]
MQWTKLIIPAFLVWLLQLLFSDLLAIGSIRPDFCLILILYWSINYGRTLGIISGFIFGLIVNLSGIGLFFGISSLTYAITGYLAGSIRMMRSRITPFHFTILWILIIFIQFFVYCIIQYQDLFVLNINVFWSKWFGTSIYTLSFIGILQFIIPLSRS